MESLPKPILLEPPNCYFWEVFYSICFVWSCFQREIDLCVFREFQVHFNSLQFLWAAFMEPYGALGTAEYILFLIPILIIEGLNWSGLYWDHQWWRPWRNDMIQMHTATVAKANGIPRPIMNILQTYSRILVIFRGLSSEAFAEANKNQISILCSVSFTLRVGAELLLFSSWDAPERPNALNLPRQRCATTRKALCVQADFGMANRRAASAWAWMSQSNGVTIEMAT